ncbi:MAG TPA: hypothetical protein VMT37_01050 [Solirubrobacterales bacterium]|nr:hypothetical protein [Solirubrobacterales bacterium]
MRRALLSALLVVLLGVLCNASAAAAPPPSLPHDLSALVPKLAGPPSATGHNRTPFEMEGKLPKQGPYEAVVVGNGGAVSIEVARHYPGGISLADYVVRGTVSRGRIQGRFGHLGAVSMRFHRSSRPLAPPRCHGPFGILHRPGTYTGRLHFRGEDGYVSLDVGRSQGFILEYDSRCQRGRGSSASARTSSTRTSFEPEYAFLDAGWKHGIGSVNFLASDDKKHGKADFIVSSETSRGRMAIKRIALLSAVHGTVKIDDAFTSGRVTAPAPFHGAGTFAAAPDGTKTWKGKLSVDLLGEPRVPLTGPDFDEVEMGRATGLTLFFLFLGSL